MAISPMLGKRMRAGLVRNVRSATRLFGIELTRYRPPDGYDDRLFLEFCRRNLSKSRSQQFQDLFVQFVLGEKEGGFFVEFGAADGLDLSNTWMLESHYGWSGILAEPARCYGQSLRQNRRCIVDSRCVWDKSGETLQFREVSDAPFSTVDSYSTHDSHAQRRQHGTLYPVESISLCDMLEQHAAPRRINVLSVDTEGSELRILRAFDFARYDIDVLVVEHNYTSDREKILSFLQSRGFSKKFENFSLRDDWYVSEQFDLLAGSRGLRAPEVEE